MTAQADQIDIVKTYETDAGIVGAVYELAGRRCSTFLGKVADAASALADALSLSSDGGLEVVDSSIEKQGSGWSAPRKARVETSDGGVYESPSTWDGMTEHFIQDKIDDFDPSDWDHVSGPQWEPEGDDEPEADETPDQVMATGSDWAADELGLLPHHVDTTWERGTTRRIRVTRDDDTWDEVLPWSDRDDLEGDVAQMGDVTLQIDGFGKTFVEQGRIACYCYVEVVDGDIDQEIDLRTTSTGSGPRCPQCGAPTAVSGQVGECCR